MSYVLRIVQLFLLCLVGGLILIIAAEQPVKAQACKIFNTCGDDNPIKLPSWDDIKREVSNCVSGGCNVPAVVQAEINSCFSGGCDPVKIYQNFDWSSEAFGELGRVLYQAAADVMQEKHAGSQSYWLSSYQKEALRPYFGALVDRVSIIYNGRMMDYLGSIGGKTLPGESNAQTYGLRIYINGSYDERNCAQLTLLAHELAHSRQYEQSGSSLSNFGYHYFKSWARNGFRYGKINFEVEAEDVEAAYYCPADEIDYPEASVGVGGSAGGHNTITPVTSPAEEAAQAINDVLQAGDIAQAVTLYEEAISVLGFDLPESLGKEICRQGLVAGQQTQVHYLCLRTVTGNLKQAQIQTQYASEAHSFLETLLRHLPQFQLTNQGITTRSMADALTRPDAGLRINATVERVWGDWLPYGPRTVQTDPATQNLTPLRILVIRLIQGRQLTLTTSEQHALYSLLTRADPPENWRNSMNGIIGAINRESFQTVFQTGNSAIADTQSVQATQAEPLLPPQNDPPPPLA
ncbi:MAG TPA: DUF4157 domain-containing protein, partial [Caldilineaceae bacterium]|nr:DUF4157 domain-containing protein [Caldilineaceae bacterium]